MRTVFALAAAAGVAIATAAPMLRTTRSDWEILPSFQAAVAFGISFTSELTGSIAGGDNGLGAAVWLTQDGGSQFATSAVPDTALMYMAVAREAENAVASGFFLPSHSSDGARSFEISMSGGGPVQSIAALGEGGFAITGATTTFNGVAISRDGGVTFPSVFEDVFNDEGATPARYGAFPSTTTWFVTGGSWPSNENTKENKQAGVHWLSERVKITHPTLANANQTYSTTFQEAKQASADPGHVNEYYGSIARTTDGGATWQTVYTNRGSFYFNEISCFNENECVAVGEASSGPDPGARVYATHDGGESWEVVVFEQGENVMAVEALATGQAWVATSRFDISTFGFVTTFWTSEDFGRTFAPTQSLDGFNVLGLSMLANGRAGFAAGMLNNQQCAVAAWRAAQ